MLKHKLENEGVSSKAAERAFDKFNDLLENEETAAKLANTIGMLAVGYRPRFWQFRARRYGRVVKKVLDTTQNGERIGASEATWKEIFEDKQHNIEIYSLTSNLESDERERQRRTIGLRTLGVVAWLNTAEGKDPSAVAENDLVTAA